MFVLDRSATYTNSGLTKYEPAYKRAVAAGVQCALQDQLIRKDFYSNLYNKQVCSHRFFYVIKIVHSLLACTSNTYLRCVLSY